MKWIDTVNVMHKWTYELKIYLHQEEHAQQDFKMNT